MSEWVEEGYSIRTSYYTSTPKRHRYKVSAIGDVDALSDLYLAIDAIGDEPPPTMEVSVRFV